MRCILLLRLRAGQDGVGIQTQKWECQKEGEMNEETTLEGCVRTLTDYRRDLDATAPAERRKPSLIRVVIAQLANQLPTEPFIGRLPFPSHMHSFAIH